MFGWAKFPGLPRGCLWPVKIVACNQEEITVYSHSDNSELDLVETQGKQNQRVPILLTKDVTMAIELLIEKQRTCGIEDNPYIFAHNDSHLDAWQVLQKVARGAGCSQPNLVPSSRLRKYLSTVCQIIDLESHELEWLSRLLSHSINTHKSYYRQHVAAIEIAKIGRLVMAADAGEIKKFSAKRLEEIDVAELQSVEDKDQEYVIEEDCHEETECTLAYPDDVHISADYENENPLDLGILDRLLLIQKPVNPVNLKKKPEKDTMVHERSNCVKDYLGLIMKYQY